MKLIIAFWPAIHAFQHINIYQDYFQSPSLELTIQDFPRPNSDLETVKISFNGKTISCDIPVLEPTVETVAILNKQELLNKALSICRKMPCLEFPGRQWDYRICYNGTVEQKVSKDLLASATDLDEDYLAELEELSYTLGVFNSTITDSRYDSQSEAGSYLTRKRDGSYFMKQLWANGDFCKMTGKPRQVELIFSCGHKDDINSVHEYSICRYRIHVSLRELCSLDQFKPSKSRAQGYLNCYVDGQFCRNGQSLSVFGYGKCQNRIECRTPFILNSHSTSFGC